MNILTNLLFPKSKQKSDADTANGLPSLNRNPRGIQIKSAPEIDKMRRSGNIVATVLKEIQEITKPGMTTADLDEYAEQRIREMGATPSFKGYYGFPASICASVNNEVVHGIPNAKKTLRRGDVLKVDTGAFCDGFHGDSCITIAVGNKVSKDAAKLIQIAEEALYTGIEQVKEGAHLLAIAGAVEDHVKAH
ncbi:MAG: M24 family metallopeptidase, partial [Cyanobacteria bacterium J06648_1]